jgi:cytochrome P450
MFEELLRRLDDIQLTSHDIAWRRGNFVLGPNSVPVSFRAR